MWFFLLLRKSFLVVYKVIFTLYYYVRYVFVSIHQSIWNPYMFKKDLNLTKRFFQHQFIPEWMSFYSLITHLTERVLYYEFLYICATSTFVILNEVFDGLAAAATFAYHKLCIEAVEIVEYINVSHLKKTICKTSEAAPKNVNRENFPDLTDIVEDQEDDRMQSC